MPLYEYHCPNCRQDFELLVRGDDKPTCPACRSVKIEKLLSVPAAPMMGKQALPVRDTPASGGCGLPQCGMGRCQWE